MEMDVKLTLRVSKILCLVFLAASLVFVALGCYLYLVWTSLPSVDRILAEPYESFLLYNQHYDWVRAPFLQAFRAASLCVILLGASRLIPRMVDSWKTWLPGLVFLFSFQIVVFNMVVNDMTGTSWLYYVYLAMSWFEPWLVVTLADIGQGLYSTGGIAVVAFAISAVSLYAVRQKQGPLAALVETCLFISSALFVFELGILEYKSSWWDSQVSEFQYALGIRWLTNHALWSATAVCEPLFICVRLALWRFGGSRARRSRLGVTSEKGV